MDEATVELMKHFKKKGDDIATDLHRARAKRINVENVQAIGDSFQRRFFNNTLAGRVMLRWASLGLEASGQTHVKEHIGNEQILIRLNRDLIAPAFERMSHKQARDQLYATILHHLIHAYFVVRCGSPDLNQDADGRLRHENHFGVIMYKIKEISGKYGDPLPINFAHSLPRRNPWHPASRQIQLYAAAINRPMANTDDRHHCTECTATLDPIPEKTINKWYQNRCLQAVNPDIYEFNGDGVLQSTPLNLIRDKKSEWIELYWQKKILKIDKSCLKMFSSPFVKKFTDENRRVDIPKVPEHTVRALWCFLNRGDYEPDLYPTKNGTRGPALIKGLDPNWTPYMENEVRIHKLATKLQLDELRRRAFARLMDMNVTYEDPIPVFQRIYNVEDGGRGPVHAELRKWSVAFMERFADNLGPGQTPLEFSNWKYLKEHSGFQYCLANGGEALNADFREAGDRLAKITMGISPQVEALQHAAQFPGNAHVAAAIRDGRVNAVAQGGKVVLPPPPPPGGASMALQHYQRVPMPVPVAVPVHSVPAIEYEEWRGRSRRRSLSPGGSVWRIYSRSPSPVVMSYDDVHWH